MNSTLTPSPDNNSLLDFYNRLVAEVSLRINERKSREAIISEVQVLFPEIEDEDLIDRVDRMIAENASIAGRHGQTDSGRPARWLAESSREQVVRGLCWIIFSATITFFLLDQKSDWGKVVSEMMRRLFNNQWSIPILAVAFVWGSFNLVLGLAQMIKPPQPE